MFCLLTGLLAASLGTAAPKVEISNIRTTYGPLGAARPENRYLPGDAVFLAFDIDGLQPDKEGRLRFRLKMVVQDAKEHNLFTDEQEVPSLGIVQGGKVRHTLQLATARDQEPGTYRIQVSVTDLVAASTPTSFTHEYQLLPPALGLVRFHASLDRFGQMPVPTVGVVGQMLTFHTTAVGFKHARTTSQAKVTVEFQLLDTNDRPVHAKPLVSEFKELPPETLFIPLRFEMLLQRPGTFKLVFKLTDDVEKKSVTLTVPLQVLEGVGK
jgi:hypothetical protein